jgi:hypothetical protein
MKKLEHGSLLAPARRAEGPVKVVAALVFSSALLAALATSPGCTDMACLEWSDERGSCPSKEEALKRFGGQSCIGNIKEVNSEAEYDGTACCYDVTKRAAGDRSCAGALGPAGQSGGPAPSGPCGGCAQFQAGEVSDLCPESVDVFNNLVACLCSGPCAVACDDGSCASSFDTDECKACVDDTSENGCGAQMAACQGDI